jgi:hypothetical protein
LITEAVAETKDLGIPLYGAFLDASKAFDVVWHEGMLAKLYELGISGPLWLLYRDMYRAMTSSVKWDGFLSPKFEEGQCVRQGGPLLNSSKPGEICYWKY